MLYNYDIYIYVHMIICIFVDMLFCTRSWALFCSEFFSRICGAELRIRSRLFWTDAKDAKRKQHLLPGIFFLCVFRIIILEALLLEVYSIKVKARSAIFFKNVKIYVRSRIYQGYESILQVFQNHMVPKMYYDNLLGCPKSPLFVWMNSFITFCSQLN